MQYTIDLDDPKVRIELQKIVFNQWQSLIHSFSLNMSNSFVEGMTLEQFMKFSFDRWGNLYKMFNELTDNDKIEFDHFVQKNINKLKELSIKET